MTFVVEPGSRCTRGPARVLAVNQLGRERGGEKEGQAAFPLCTRGVGGKSRMVKRTARLLGLESALRPRGRPRKETKEGANDAKQP